MPIASPFGMMSIAQVEELVGYKIRTTSLITPYTKGSSTSAASRVFFGDWSQFIMAFWEGFEIMASDVAEDAMKKRQIHITAYQGIDFGMKDETGMTVLADALINSTYFGT